MLLDIRNPLLPRLIGVMLEVRRPRPLDDVLRSRTVHHDLVTEATGLGQHEQIQRVREVVAVDDRILLWILGLERHRAAGLGREELGNHGKGMFLIDGELVILLGTAVAFGGEELDVGLFGGEAHWVAAGLAGGVAPEGLILETVVEAREGEAAEGEGGEEAGLVFFPLLVGFGEVVVVVDVEVVREAFFFGFVEHEDDLRDEYRVFCGPGGGEMGWDLRGGPGGSYPRRGDRLGRGCRADPIPRERRFPSA